MIHYSCDLCGARLDADDEKRYVVKIEVYAAADEPGRGDSFEDFDEQLSGLNDPPPGMPEAADKPKYHGLRFDLCARCRRRYLSDPLFSAAKKRTGYSEN